MKLKNTPLLFIFVLVLQACASMPIAEEATQISPAVTTTAVLCDDMSYDPYTTDITIPDGTVMSPGQEFVKTWEIKNTGSCVWSDQYKLYYVFGEKMSGVPQPLPNMIEAGQEIEVSVSFKAPDKAGEYVSAWQMANAKGIPLGKFLYVKILVK